MTDVSYDSRGGYSRGPTESWRKASQRPWLRIWRMMATAALAALLSSAAHGQTQLFTAVDKGKNFDETPTQTERLARLQKLPTTRSIRLVRINPDALADNKLAIPLFLPKSLTFHKAAGEMRDSRDFTWTGISKDDLPGGTTLVVRNGEITGSISTPQGLYRISSLGGGVHALVEVDATKFPKDEPESFRSKESQQVSFESAGHLDSQHSAGGTLTQIDVLVAYTPAAKAAVNDIDATISLAIAEANQSYLNSGISIHLNLVDSFQVNYTERGKAFEVILSDFKGMADVNKRRDQSGADLAALIINKSDYCGLADEIMANASSAFAIVHYDCATGYYSFAHELGHLMGARHNEQMDPGTAPFAYGHGYRHDGPAPGWRTIMAYDCPAHCQRLQYWSNPNQEYGQDMMGTVALNDNVRVLNQTASTVAAFRTHPTP